MKGTPECAHADIELQGLELSNKTVEKMTIMNRRTLDQIAARVYFYHGRFHELSNKLAEIRP